MNQMMIDEYRELFALTLVTTHQKGDTNYRDLLMNTAPEKTQREYADGLLNLCSYMIAKYRLTFADVSHIHDTVLECMVTGFVADITGATR